MYRETVESSGLVWQSVDSSRLVTFECIPSTLGSRSCFGCREGIETCELFVCAVDLDLSIYGGQNHITLLQNSLNQVFDGWILLAREESRSLANLNAVSYGAGSEKGGLAMLERLAW